MAGELISIRGTIEFLRKRNEILCIKNEIDPDLEISGIEKSLEGGPALLFENVKGYPRLRQIANLFSREDTIAAMFGVPAYGDLKFKGLDAIKNPVPPKVVEKAPCQEVVKTKEIDVRATLPIMKYTEWDSGSVFGGGVVLLTGKHYPAGGSELSFKRMTFKGNDWGSLLSLAGSHLSIAAEKADRLPLTINICPPPAIMFVAGASTLKEIIPYGSDELGIAGAMQGSPIEIVKAKTVEGYAISNSEWVLEGYLTSQPVFESEALEYNIRTGQTGRAILFPEWHGYYGDAHKARRLVITAITHRADLPIFYSSLADGYAIENFVSPLRETCFYDLAQRIWPGLVINVSILHGMKQVGGIVYQVRKTKASDDKIVKTLLRNALTAGGYLRLAIAVDDDVDIYCADDVLWAIWTRADYDTGLLKGDAGSIVVSSAPPFKRTLSIDSLGIDATVPYIHRNQYMRAQYPVDKIDLGKWLSSDEISAAKAQQTGYAKFLSESGR